MKTEKYTSEELEAAKLCRESLIETLTHIADDIEKEFKKVDKIVGEENLPKWRINHC